MASVILQWLGVGQSEIQKVTSSKKFIKTYNVDPTSINSAVLDEHVDIYLVRRLFTNTAWHKITKAVEMKRKDNVWFCGHCNHNLDNEVQLRVIHASRGIIYHVVA